MTLSTLSLPQETAAVGEAVKCPECVFKVFPSDSEAGPQKEGGLSMPGQAPCLGSPLSPDKTMSVGPLGETGAARGCQCGVE